MPGRVSRSGVDPGPTFSKFYLKFGRLFRERISLEIWARVARPAKKSPFREISDFIFKAGGGDVATSLEVLVVDLEVVDGAEGGVRARTRERSKLLLLLELLRPGLRVGWLRRHVVKEVLG